MTTSNENQETRSPHLRKMIHKLENRQPKTSGYIAYKPELVDILSELTDLVPLNVMSSHTSPDEDMVEVTIKLGFLISKSELDEADLIHQKENKKSEYNI